jgi:hypothetical protein
MKAPIKIITVIGTEIPLEQWQQIYGLEIGSTQIGRFFDATEHKFSEDIQRYGVLIVNELLIRLLDHFRATIKQPVTINSFNRDENKQKELQESGYKAAAYSPHVAKMAADIDTKSPEQTRAWAIMLQRCAIELHIKIRIGYEQYLKAGQTFIHVDVCPEFYAPGRPFNKQFHPVQWEKVTNW